MLLSDQDSSVSVVKTVTRVAGQAQHPRPMLFSPWYFGHHPTYLRHLILDWYQQKFLGTLSIVVMPSFLDNHPDIVALTETALAETGAAIDLTLEPVEPKSGVQLVAMTNEEQADLESRSSGWQRALAQYELIVRYTTQLRASHCLLMHLDSCLLPLVLGRKLPCAFSGIYFRPTFHYRHFAHYSPSWKEQLQHWRERLFLARLLAHPQLKTLFCLDPLAVAPINQQGSSSRPAAVHLADPVCLTLAPNQQVEQLRQRLEIEPGRQVYLAFGSLAEGRKGTEQLLEALALLPLQLCQKLCLLLVGEPFPDRQALLETWLAPLRQTLPIQIVTRFGYLPEPEVPLFFQLSDAVLAPYQKHAGMSGILLQAAVAQKPILSSNYGLMGELVQQYGLGLAVDTTVPSEIARGLAQLIRELSTNESPEQLLSEMLSEPFAGDLDRINSTRINLSGMKQFAELNSVARFTQTIFSQIYARS
jgi:glycosyltransferase involved in cell wall biosynthesis